MEEAMMTISMIRIAVLAVVALAGVAGENGASNREIANLVQGSGPHSGYVTLASGADTTVSAWQGNVVTALGANSQPTTRFKGKWTTSRGTGKYAGSTGSGTYEGQILSQSEYTLTWKGEVKLDQRASR
jgi:hypothetical protein